MLVTQDMCNVPHRMFCLLETEGRVSEESNRVSAQSDRGQESHVEDIAGGAVYINRRTCRRTGKLSPHSSTCGVSGAH